MKRIPIFVVLALLGFGAWYGYTEYHRKNVDLSTAKPSLSADDVSLVNAFEKDSTRASKQYIDQVIAVSGTIKKIVNDDARWVIFLGDASRMSSVLCSMDPSHPTAYGSLQEGAKVTVMGMCNGYVSDELLGTDVTLNRCVVLKQ
jgi:hypothetical protein